MIVSRTDTKTLDKVYGITGVTMDGSRQLYPYETIAEAKNNERLIEIQANPEDPRFKDPKYVSTLKALDRV